jgi:hypothetical protein
VNHGKLGRSPTRHDLRTVRLNTLDMSQLPAAPLSRDWSRQYDAHGWMGAPLTYGTYGNMQYGDCTCAAFGHLDRTVAAQTGTVQLVDEPLVLEAYDAISPWSRTTPLENDFGAANLDALRWFKDRGIIVGFASLWMRSQVELCIDLFHGVYVGAELPRSAMTQQVWDVAPKGVIDSAYKPRTWGGHAMMAVGYDQGGVWFITWGRRQYATWAWFNMYVDEAYVPLHRWLVADGSKLSPAGYLAQQITDALAILKG